MDTKFHEAFKKAIHDSFNIICPCHNKNPIKIYNITSWVSNYFLRFIHWDVLATMLYKRVVNKFQFNTSTYYNKLILNFHIYFSQLPLWLHSYLYFV